MIVAFFKITKTGLKENYAEILYNFFKFYGSFFNPSEIGISLFLEPRFLYIKLFFFLIIFVL